MCGNNDQAKRKKTVMNTLRMRKEPWLKTVEILVIRKEYYKKCNADKFENQNK